MEDAFELDERLSADAIHVGDLTVSTVLLVNDARYPWLILVPRRAGVREFTDLSDADAATLMAEIKVATAVMLKLANPDKVNVGALGNVVEQLHVHVIGRFRSDPAWPGPVWGAGDPMPYPDHSSAEITERVAALFAEA